MLHGLGRIGEVRADGAHCREVRTVSEHPIEAGVASRRTRSAECNRCQSRACPEGFREVSIGGLHHVVEAGCLQSIAAAEQAFEIGHVARE